MQVILAASFSELGYLARHIIQVVFCVYVIVLSRMPALQCLCNPCPQHTIRVYVVASTCSGSKHTGHSSSYLGGGWDRGAAVFPVEGDVDVVVSFRSRPSSSS